MQVYIPWEQHVWHEDTHSEEVSGPQGNFFSETWQFVSFFGMLLVLS